MTQWFPPEPTGPPLWIADAVRTHGMDVRVVTGIPNYPTGKPAPGYRASRVRRETIAGFETLRCPLYPSHDSNAWKRVLNYSSFAASASWFGRRTIEQADVALVYSSPATAAVPAFLAHRRSGTPYVLVVQDLWPETVLQTDVLGNGRTRPIVAKHLGRFVECLDESASRILVISPGMRDILVTRGVAADKIAVMFNWVDENLVKPVPATGALRRELNIGKSDLLLLYGGNLGSAQGLSAWIDAWIDPLIDSSTHLVVMGDGMDRDLLQKQAQGIAHQVHVLAGRSASLYAEAVADADALVVSLQDQPLFRMTIPGKVQASLAFGKPILATLAGDAAHVLTASKAALVTEPGDVAGIARSVSEFQKLNPEERVNMGQAGRQYYLSRMSQKHGSATLINALRDAAATASRASPEA